MKNNQGSLISQYANLVNQPSGNDALADSLERAGSQTAIGPAGYEANALLSGAASGVRANSAKARQEKLSRLEGDLTQLMNYNRQVASAAAEGEMQKQQTVKFFQQSAIPIAELSKASLAGDTNAANKIAQGLLRNYRQTFQDASVGDFDHIHNGTIYYENPKTGDIEGRNVMQLMYQSGIKPLELWGQDAGMVEAGLSPGAKQNYENTQRTQQAEMKHTDLLNQKLSSDINQQEKKAQQQPYNKEVAKYNLKYLDEQRPKLKRNEVLVSTLDDFANSIRAAIKEGSAGGTPTAQLKRQLQKIAGTDKNATLAEMFEQVYFHRVKEVGGSNPSSFELKVAKAAMPSLDKNPEAVLQAIEADKQRAFKEIMQYKKQEEALRNSNYQMSPDDPSIMENFDDEYQAYLNKLNGARQNRTNPAAASGTSVEDIEDRIFEK